MFRITQDPSSGKLLQCLAKNYKNDSIVSVDMDKFGVMAAYSDALCTSVVHCISTEMHGANTKICFNIILPSTLMFDVNSPWPHHQSTVCVCPPPLPHAPPISFFSN